jgi:voltage-gated potassium channel
MTAAGLHVPVRRLLFVAVIPLLLVVTGTIGYHLIERWPLGDALYMTVITLTTIGFSEVHPLHRGGRAFTMLLAMGGIFSLFFAATELIRSIVTGEIASLLGRQRMERNLSQLQGHLIVCGFGRMGRFVCREFSALAMPFVVIDRDPRPLENFDMPHGIALHGDATVDEILRRAGVDRARALVTVVATDADNLYITMSARFLNEKVFIVARAEDEHAVEKLERGGANRVISPYTLSGHRVAQAVLRPAVLDFIELATRRGHLELQIEETRVGAGSSLAGGTLGASRVSADLGVIVLALKSRDGRMVVNPPPDTRLEVDDTLVALGNRQQLDRLDALARA